MIDCLPCEGEPSWLQWISVRGDLQEFPLQEVLAGSLFYPASGFDGDPIKYLAGNYYSFVHVDYGLSREELYAEVKQRGFLGYELIANRSLSERELTPGGWRPIRPEARDGDPKRGMEWSKPPFCEWMIFKRNDSYTCDHGPMHFSLIHLCADGVAAFQALYLSNALAPGALAIIQPGTGFGGNWTDFTDSSKILARSVLNNPNGLPDILLYGGSGGKAFYSKPCWPEYSKMLCFLGDSSIGVWRRSEVL